MEIEFWYSNSITITGIQFTTETLYNTISFKNIDTDIIDTTKLNFLVFNWKISSTHIHSIEFIKLLKELQQKEQDITKPIYEKIKTSIQKVGKAKGYQYVLNSEGLLLADGPEITNDVKKDLGF